MLHIRILRKALVVILFATASLVQAQGNQSEPPSRTWRLTDDMKSDGFSGTILVNRHGRTVYQQNFGLADKSFGVPITRQTRFRIASITKLFTSVAVLRLADKVRIPRSSRAAFRFDRARHSEMMARSVPRIVRAAFRNDRAQFEVRGT